MGNQNNYHQRNTKQEHNQQQEDNKIEIEVTDIEPFKYSSRTGYITGIDLGVRLNRLFYNLFSDFNGCQITPINGKVYIYLHFAEPDSNNNLELPRAFEPIQIEKNASLGLATLQLSNLVFNKRRYQITDFGREILSQFIFSNSVKDFDSKQLTVEEPHTTFVGGRQVQSIITKCIGFDTDKLVRKVLPNIKKQDLILLTFIKPINFINTQNGRYDNKLYRLEIMDSEEFKRMGEIYGIGNIQHLNSGNPDIIRGY